jgi:hypothetical protein
MSKNETIYTPILKKIEEEKNAVIGHMASGRPQSYQEYQRLVGRIEGLSFLQEEVLLLERKYIDD